MIVLLVICLCIKLVVAPLLAVYNVIKNNLFVLSTFIKKQEMIDITPNVYYTIHYNRFTHCFIKHELLCDYVHYNTTLTDVSLLFITIITPSASLWQTQFTNSMDEIPDLRAPMGYFDHTMWPGVAVLHTAHWVAHLYEQYSTFRYCISKFWINTYSLYKL